MKKLLFICILFFGLFFSSDMKGETLTQYYSLSWNIGLPTGSSADYTNDVSLAGGDFRGQIFIRDYIAVGFRIGYDRFYQNTGRKTVEIEPGVLMTGSAYHLISSVPVQVGAFYHLMEPESIVRPYVGLLLGASYLEQGKFFQDLGIKKNNWGFSVAPEVGTYVRFGSNSPIGLHLAISYNYNTNGFDIAGKSYTDFQNFNFNIGLAYMMW